jgi:hypothetical protein
MMNPRNRNLIDSTQRVGLLTALKYCSNVFHHRVGHTTERATASINLPAGQILEPLSTKQLHFYLKIN